MKGNKIKKEGILKGKLGKIVITLIAFSCIFFILLTSVAPKRYELSAGDIATQDIKAPRETVDEKATNAKIKEATNNVDKQYTNKTEVKQKAIEEVNSWFQDIIDEKKSQEAEQSKIAKLSDKMKLTYDEAESLLNLSESKINDFSKLLSEFIDSVYTKNTIIEGNVEDLTSAKNIIKSDIDNSVIDNDVKEVFKKIAVNEINPNFFYDEEKTNEKIEEVKKTVEQVVVKKNQIIVKDGEPVTDSQIDILNSLGLLSQGESASTWLLYANLALFVVLILLVETIYVCKFNKHSEMSKDKALILIDIITVITLLLAKGFSYISIYLIPLACAPILISQLIDYKTSIIINSMNLVYVAVIAEFDSKVIMIGIVNILIASVILKKVEQRNQIMYSILYLALISTLINFSVEVILSTNMKVVLINCMYSALGVAISGVIAIGILPFLETTFNVMTIVKLLEISNPNSPLLKRLLMEAPGTYHHSMMVANLAEVAADEVGANPVITRVGAYYHDVGKLERPYFFKENQYNNENPHDNIAPNLSALIIISHVKDGVELARKNKIPERIIDVIREHHGTTLVKYFYYTVKNAAENPDEINEDDYKYPGPNPKSKESAIIMLADSTEAAVRSIKEPNEEKIIEMITNIIDDKLNSGQLNDCDLTLKDIQKIKQCFFKSYNGMYHKRIEYPTELKRDSEKIKQN